MDGRERRGDPRHDGEPVRRAAVGPLHGEAGRAAATRSTCTCSTGPRTAGWRCRASATRSARGATARPAEAALEVARDGRRRRRRVAGADARPGVHRGRARGRRGAGRLPHAARSRRAADVFVERTRWRSTSPEGLERALHARRHRADGASARLRAALRDRPRPRPCARAPSTAGSAVSEVAERRSGRVEPLAADAALANPQPGLVRERSTRATGTRLPDFDALERQRDDVVHDVRLDDEVRARALRPAVPRLPRGAGRRASTASASTSDDGVAPVGGRPAGRRQRRPARPPGAGRGRSRSGGATTRSWWSGSTRPGGATLGLEVGEAGGPLAPLDGLRLFRD